MGHVNDIAIDMEKTGERIAFYLKLLGISVKDLQKYLRLSCPQPIYRWIKGKMLPTIDHLYIMSVVFGVRMEDILVEKESYESPLIDYSFSKGCIEQNRMNSVINREKRFFAYRNKLALHEYKKNNG